MPDAPRLPEVLAVRRGARDAALDLRVPADLFWLQGHFPAAPILPGVVQLDWALYFARQHLDLPIQAAPRFKVKFRTAILPEDRLILTLTLTPPDGRQELSFQYRRGEAVCSNGQIVLPP